MKGCNIEFSGYYLRHFLYRAIVSLNPKYRASEMSE